MNFKIFTPFEKKIALRYLSAKGRGFGSVISWVSLIGIALGVMTLIVVMSVMNGFHDALLSRIVGMNGHVVIYHQDGAISDYDFLIEKLNSDKNIATKVSGIVPIAEGQVMATAKGKASGAMLRGIKMGDLADKTGVGAKIYGTELKNVRGGELVMGMSLARSLRLTLGDAVSLASASGAVPTAFGTIPRMASYPVRSTFFMGMHEYDSGFIFMPLDAAQKYLNIEGAATHIDLFLKNPNDTDVVRASVMNILPAEFVVRDWRDLNRGFVGALQVETNVMFLILMLIIIVAAFNIISSLVMLVKDKSRDIAVMRSFGVSRKSMMKIFILSGTSIGIAGAVVGSVVGVIFAHYIEEVRKFFQFATGRDLFPAELYYLSELPHKTEVMTVIGIALTAIILSFLATLYPAWKAAKTDPVEVLRNE